METQPEILSNKTPFCLVLFFFFSLFFYYYNDKYEPGYKLVPAKEEHVRSRPPRPVSEEGRGQPGQKQQVPLTLYRDK